MQLINYLKSKTHLIGALSLLFGLASCGSYQYVGQDNDGIYGNSERTVEYQENDYQENPDTQNSNYYQNYFKQLSQEEMIFTDIDSYEGEYEVENDSLEYQDSYAGWGEDNSDVTININGGHLYNSIRWNSLFYPSLYWNYGNIYGFNNYWDPLYYGSYWDRPFWRNRYYGQPYYYGYGYNYYYGNNYGNYYNRYYSNRRLAYNSGRRGSLYTNSNRIGLSNRQSFVNRNTSRRSSVQSNTTRSRSNTSTNSRRRINRDVGPTNSRRNVISRSRSTTTRPRTTTSRPRSTVTPRTSNTRTNTTRSRSTINRSRSNNNSSSSYRPSTSRSSSSVRSSSNSTRSSSSSRSSGRSSSSRRGNNI